MKARSMYLYKTLVGPSTIVGVVVGRFRSLDEDDLVLCKGTTLELRAIDKALVLVHQQHVFAKVAALKTLSAECQPWDRERMCDKIVLLSATGRLSIVEFNVDSSRFVVLHHMEISLRGCSQGNNRLHLAVAPNSTAVCVSRGSGSVAVVWIDANHFKFCNEQVYHLGETKSTDLLSRDLWSMCFFAPHKETRDWHIASLIQTGTGYSFNLEILRCSFASGISHICRICIPLTSKWASLLGNPKRLEAIPGDPQVLIVLGDRGFAALDCSVIHTVGTFMPEPMGMQISADRKGCQGNIVLLALRSLRKFPEGSTKDYLQANWFSPMNQMQLLNLAKGSSECEPARHGESFLTDTKSDFCHFSDLERSRHVILDAVWARSEPDNKTTVFAEFSLHVSVKGPEMPIYEINMKKVSSDNECLWDITIQEAFYKLSGPTTNMAALSYGRLAAFSCTGNVCIIKPPNAQIPALHSSPHGVIEQQHVNNTYSPLHDFAVVEGVESKTGITVCAACGEGQTGCLQLVRTGCGVSVIHSEDDPESELKEAGNLWAIKECSHDSVDHVMVVSFTMATRALGIGLKFRDLTDALGLVSEVTTLACGRIHDHLLVQVTPTCVALCNMEGVSSNSSSSVHDVPGSGTFQPYSDTKSVDNGMARCTQESQASPRNKWTSHESYAAEDIFETSSITVASVAEGIACIFSGDAQELTVLGVRQQKCVDPGGNEAAHRRQGCASELEVWGSIVLCNDAPSCSQVIRNETLSSWYCIVGTYEPGISVFLVPAPGKAPIPLTCLSGQRLCSGLNLLHGELGLVSLGHTGTNSHILDEPPPIPESIVAFPTLHMPAKQAVTFLIGFRNGMLGNYLLKQAEERVILECTSLINIGTHPICLGRVDHERILCMSDSIFIVRRSQSSGELLTYPISLPPNIVTGVVFMADESIWSSVHKQSHEPLNSTDTLCDIPGAISCSIPVLASVDGARDFTLTALCSSIESVPLQATPQFVMRVPGRLRMLTTCSYSTTSTPNAPDTHDIRLIDMASSKEESRFTMPPGAKITSVCLWPPVDSTNLMQEEMSDISVGPTAASLGMLCQGVLTAEELATQQVDSIYCPMAEPGASSARDCTNSGIQSCLSVVKGMAAALSCCGSLARPPSSLASSPKCQDLQGNDANNRGEGDKGFLITVATSYNRRLSAQAVHRGDLFLLRACSQPGSPSCFQQQSKSWFFSVVSQKKMPDPVIAVAQLTDDLLVSSIGQRLVCYKMSGKSWEKKGWIATHDVITRLSADSESMVVAAGDEYNSVVLYKYSREFEEFQVIFSDPCSRTNMDVLLPGWENHVFAIDTDGFFSDLYPAIEGILPGSLRVSALFNVREPLSRMVPLQGGLKGSILISTVSGALRLLTPLPPAIATIMSATETLLLALSPTQPLTGDPHIALHSGFEESTSVTEITGRKNIVDGDLLSELLHLPPQQWKDLLKSLTANPKLQDIVKDLCAVQASFSCKEEQTMSAVAQTILHIIQNINCQLLRGQEV